MIKYSRMLDFKKLEGFDWNEGNLDHIKKHNVDYKECESIFSNKPLFISEDEEHSRLEKRYRAYGKSDFNRLLNVIFTVRRNNMRVISARDQNKKERREFQKSGGEIQ